MVMQLGLLPLGVLAGTLLPRWLGGQEPTASATAPAAPTTPPPLPDAHGALEDVLSRYDVRRISPREFSELLSRLSDSGAVTQADLTDLTSIRLELDRQQTDPDALIDLLAWSREELTTARQQQNAAQLSGTASQPNARSAAAGRWVSWMERFTRLHSGPFDGGVDTSI